LWVAVGFKKKCKHSRFGLTLPELGIATNRYSSKETNLLGVLLDNCSALNENSPIFSPHPIRNSQSKQQLRVLGDKRWMFASEIHIPDEPANLAASCNIQIDSSIATECGLKEGGHFVIRFKLWQRRRRIRNLVLCDWLALTAGFGTTSEEGATLMALTRFCPKGAVSLNQLLADLLGIQNSNVECFAS
jgi:hypothetical protein